MNMKDWTVICRVEDIPVLGARRVARPQGAAVAVFRNADDEVFALQGEPDPWFEADKARVDTRQFIPIVPAEVRQGEPA